jgi:hypothetical protein
MAQVKVTWKAFGEDPDAGRFITSVEFTYAEDFGWTAQDICEKVFRDTNVYNGEVWDIIEPLLSGKRTHTAVSVGDEVEVDGVTFRCDSVGWSELEGSL